MTLASAREVAPLLRKIAHCGALTFSSELFKTTISLNGDVYTHMAAPAAGADSEAFLERYRAHQRLVTNGLQPLLLIAELPRLAARLLAWCGAALVSLSVLLAGLEQRVSLLHLLSLGAGTLLWTCAGWLTRSLLRVWLKRTLRSVPWNSNVSP
jgi:hypothetical protein